MGWRENRKTAHPLESTLGVIVGPRREGSRVGKVPFGLWPEAFALKGRGREFGRGFHTAETAISHPVSIFFFLSNRPLECQRQQWTPMQKLHFPVSLAGRSSLHVRSWVQF